MKLSTTITDFLLNLSLNEWELCPDSTQTLSVHRDLDLYTKCVQPSTVWQDTLIPVYKLFTAIWLQRCVILSLTRCISSDRRRSEQIIARRHLMPSWQKLMSRPDFLPRRWQWCWHAYIFRPRAVVKSTVRQLEAAVAVLCHRMCVCVCLDRLGGW